MNPSHSRRFVRFGSRQPMPESKEPRENMYSGPFYGLLCTIGHFMAYRARFLKQLALGTNDFAVICGHFMVVLTARLFLKRHTTAPLTKLCFQTKVTTDNGTSD